ncbi:peptide/nickel transport system substrate-binding protein [Natronocella acetinitrilica]|uniref:Peptide/nickel transport system substrate-binding protein n=1 Tax=Natronocella acetinitrilica TaxID=414046 RepID=A0AAE3G0P1_9GAMM|nr:ABC transporter substrate-binding protein [Natronocella acetinitrilica]MCP1673585.1 peptide/nickel transport system substrate-binding protein [Natronocella acetinitrilica]
MRKNRLATVLAFLIILMGASLSNSVASDLKVIRYVPNGDFSQLDPIWTTSYIVRNHGYMVWDTLFALDENLEVQPQMVDTWSVSDDGLQYTFTLREGLIWHDGEPVTARDCVASIRRWGARDGMGRMLMRFTSSLDVVDDATFTLTLNEPYGLVLESLGKLSSNVPFMMPERLANVSPNEQITDVIGSGPFVFVESEYEPGNRAVYERFDGYVPRDEPASLAAGGKVVHVDRVEWYYIPDAQTAVSALRRGEVDFYEMPPIDLIGQLERHDDIIVEVLDPIGAHAMLRPNFLQPPFDNELVRRALYYATDQRDYMYTMVGNPEYFVDHCGSFFVCGTTYGVETGAENSNGKNLEKARALLEEAGYQGERVVILDPTDLAPMHALATVTAQALRDIGMNVQLRATDWASVFSLRTNRGPVEEGGWSLFGTWWTGADVLNPISNVAVTTDDGSWFGWPENAEIDQLRLDWARASDEERPAITEQLHQALYDFGIYLPVGQWVQPSAYRSNLQGFISSPVPFFWNVMVD